MDIELFIFSDFKEYVLLVNMATIQNLQKIEVKKKISLKLFSLAVTISDETTILRSIFKEVQKFTLYENSKVLMNFITYPKILFMISGKFQNSMLTL
ncbi:hypothetical protein Avbf_11427 [Armadillidium vulgare]|nr:hypothetical protein Avbf_11427 [Armadillidium vulgare]